MTKRLSAAMRRLVRDRAGGYCAYCLTDRRSDHFRLAKNGKIIPLTPIGRVTASLLKLNLPHTVELRRAQMQVKPYPPAILT